MLSCSKCFCAGWDGLHDLFANDILCLFVRPQPEKHRLTQLVIMSPLGELDLDDKRGFYPLATFHDRQANTLAPSAFRFLREIHKRTIGLFQFLELAVENC